ncbi:hypothetical protein PMAC_002181 [Pneumocystis sp. 'macacae']|nr:hypothetical protein PMAC_002181 [Pneumocystis sp. 'macacae']
MDDLSDELLALAGHKDIENTSKKNKLPHKKKVIESLRSNDNSSDELYSSEYSTESKNLVSRDEDDNDMEKYTIPYVLEGKFKDEEDRKRIMSMNEVERESILYEREEETQKLQEKRELAERLKQKKLSIKKQLKTKRSIQGTKNTQTISKKDKLTELKRKREEKYSRAEPELDNKIFKKRNKQKFNKENKDEYGMKDAENKDEASILDLSDVNNARLGRKHFAKFLFHPLFEETIIGIVLVHSMRIYDLIFKKEFDRWIQQLKQDKIAMPKKSLIEKKITELSLMTQHKLTDLEISDMIARRKALQKIPGNIAVEKTQLKKTRDIAIAHGDEKEAKRLTEKLNTLEELSAEKRHVLVHLDKLAKLNEKNRKANLDTIRQAEIQANEERRKQSVFPIIANPFSRLKTNPKLFYDNMLSGAQKLVLPQIKDADENTQTPRTHTKMNPTDTKEVENNKVHAFKSLAPKATKYINNKDEIIAQSNFNLDFDI